MRAAAIVPAAALWPAMAEDYSSHTTKIVSPHPPGGTTDILARILAPELLLTRFT